MPKAINPLADLAWCTMSEDAIVAKLANDLVRKGRRWRRGEQKDIKAAVKGTRPHRGIGKARLEAVIAEMKRQEPIYRQRRYKDIIDWSAWTQPSLSHRRNEVWRAIMGANCDETCVCITRLQGTLVLLTESRYYRDGQMVLRRRDGTHHVFNVKGVMKTSRPVSVALRNFDPNKVVTRALERGDSVSLDFANFTTSINGRVTVGWLDSSLLIRPEEDQAE